MAIKQKRSLCSGVNYFRTCEAERSKEISHISILALIAAAVAAVFS